MMLVTGATGNIGRVLLDALASRGEGTTGGLRGLTRDVGRAAFPAGVEAVEGDLAEAASLGPALAGVHSMFLPSRVGADEEVLDAARRAGVEHVVLVSSVTVQTHPHLGPARENLAVEKLLKGSGMAWTILRPTQYASNTLWWAPAILAGEPVRVPYADTGLPTIHPGDISAVAQAALTDPEHRGRTYALTGPVRVTPREQVEAIAKALGRQVPFAEIDRGQAHRDMAALFGAEGADAVLDLMGGDVNDELLAVRDTVERITGSQARTFEQWAAEHAPAFGGPRFDSSGGGL
ncbi:NAD(P)H-binding protein [Streptomyces sp. NPDC048606]|uniref:NAD(P)H-binding protein n=1 Tax=Streptomyces sp. NPDC048606 TaxID=3154726 RepID=UPI0034432147